MGQPIYAVAAEVPDGRSLTAGKPYPVVREAFGGILFSIVDDAGSEIDCLWESCAFLAGGNWQRVDQTGQAAQ